MDAWNELPAFEAQEFSPFYAEDDSAAARNVAVGLDENRRHVRTPSKRSFAKAENAARLLERLPDPGESIHCVMGAHVDGWSLVPAVLQLAAPAAIAKLWIATLGFNRSNEELFTKATHNARNAP